MSLILRTPWTRQPPASVLINRAHPLAKKFDTFVNFNGPSGLRNLITQGEAVTSTVAGFSPTVNGLGVTSTGSGRVALNQVGNYTSGSFFLAFQIRLDSAAGSPVLIYKGPYAGAGYYTQLSASNEILFFCGGNYATTSANALVAGQTATVVITGTVGTTSWDIYVDGVNLTSFRPTLTPTTSSNSLDLLAYGGGTSNYTSGAIIWFGCGPNLLSQAEASHLARRPWNLFAPLPRRIWVPVSAGSGTQTLTPDLFTNNNTFYTHTVTTGAVTLTPDLFTNTNSFYTPTVSSSYIVTPDLFTNTNTFYTPVVTNLSTLYPDLFTNSETFYTHIVTGGGGQTLEPELFSNSATFYGPTITVGSVTLTASLFTNTNDIYSHTVTSNYPLTPDLFSNSSSFYTPTISVGAVTLTPSLFTNSNTFYTHTISNSSTTIYFWKRTA